MQYDNNYSTILSYNNEQYFRLSEDNWYKIEPIKWEIVEEHTNGKTNSQAFTLISTKILDGSYYQTEKHDENEKSIYDNLFYYEASRSEIYTSDLYEKVSSMLDEFNSCCLRLKAVMYGLISGNEAYADYKDIYEQKQETGALTFEELYVSYLRVPSYTDIYYAGNWNAYEETSGNQKYYSWTMTKEATPFASAKGANSNWWLSTGCTNGVYQAWYVTEDGEVEYDDIATYKGVVPMIRITTGNLLSCGHVSDQGEYYFNCENIETKHDETYHWEEWIYKCLVDCGAEDEVRIMNKTENNKTKQSSIYTQIENNSFSHKTITTYTCGVCDETFQIEMEETHNWGEIWYDSDDGCYKRTCSVCGYVINMSSEHNLEKSISYQSIDSTTQHNIVTTYKCENCSYSFATATTESHSFLTKYTYVNNGSSGHQVYKCQTCTKCGYSTTPVDQGEKSHKLLNNMCMFCDYGKIMIFLPNSSHSGCETCDDHENVLNLSFDCQGFVSSLKQSSGSAFETDLLDEQEILLNDKKKSEMLLFVDKRYMSNGYEAKNFQI